MQRSLGTAALALLLVAPTAAAQRRVAPARPDRIWFAQGNIGPLLEMNPRTVGGFALQSEGGGHFGDAEGFFLSLGAAAGIGEWLVELDTGQAVLSWSAAIYLRTGYDITVVSSNDLAFQIGPYVGLGGAFYGGVGSRRSAEGGFDIRWGVDLRLLLADRLVTLYARLVDFDVVVGPTEPYVQWTPTLGAGVNLF